MPVTGEGGGHARVSRDAGRGGGERDRGVREARVHGGDVYRAGVLHTCPGVATCTGRGLAHVSTCGDVFRAA